jgi:hypothetical protein
MTHIPVEVVAPSIRVTGVAVHADHLPARISLAPGQSRAVRVHLTWPSGGFRIGKRTVTAAGTLEVTGNVHSPWAPVLTRDLGLPFAPTLRGGTAAFQATGEVGWSLLAFTLLMGAAMLVALAAILVWLVLNPTLHGVLTFERAGRDLDPLPLSGRKVAFGGPTSHDPRLPGSGVIRGRRHASRPRRRGEDIELAIRYSLDGSPSRTVRGRCPAHDVIILNGVTFGYQPDSGPGPGSSSASSAGGASRSS